MNTVNSTNINVALSRNIPMKRQGSGAQGRLLATTALALVLATAMPADVSAQTDGIYTGASGGDWGTATNWDTDPTIPNASGDIATIDSMFVTVGSNNYTIGQLNLLNGGTVTGSSTLTLDNGTDPAVINADNGFLVGATISLTGETQVKGGLLQITSGTVAGAGSFTVDSSLNLQTANTFSGGVTVNSGGTVFVGNDSALGTGAVSNSGKILAFGDVTLSNDFVFPTNASSATLAAANGKTLTLTGKGGFGSGSVVHVGSGSADGVVSIAASGGYTGGGGFAVDAGTLRVGGFGFANFPLTYGASTTIASGATLDLNGFDSTVNMLTSAASDSVVTNDSATNDATLTTKGSSSYAGQIKDGGTHKLALSVAAGAVTTLSGDNSYTGGTTVAGELVLGSNNAAGGASGQITTTGSTITYLNGINSATPIVIASDTTKLNVEGNDTATQSGVISESGGVRPLEKVGTGTLVLAAANTYTGDTMVSAGTLDVTGSIKSAEVTVGPGATLKVDGASLLDTATVRLTSSGNMTLSGRETIGTLVSVSAISSLTLGSQWLTVASANATTFAGTITSTDAGSLIMSGAGTLTLAGSNTGYDGFAVIDSGTFALTNADALGTASVIFNGDGALMANGVDVTVKDALVIRPGSTATIGATSGNTLSFIDDVILTAVSGTTHFGSATHTGTVRLGFTGGSASTGSIAIDGGTVRIDTGVAALALQYGGGQGIAIGTGATSATLDIGGIGPTLNDLSGNAQGIITNTGAAAMLTTYNVADTTFAGVIKDGTGQLALIKRGSGALTLAGINTYTGDTTVAEGTLDVTGSIKSAGVTVESGGTLKVDGASLLDSAAVTLNGSGNLTLSGDETIGTLISASSTSALTLGANTLTVAPASATTFAGAITGTGGLTKNGAGTLTLSGSSAGFTGVATIGAGALSLTNADALGSAGVTFAGDGVLEANGVDVSLSGNTTINTGVNATFGATSGNTLTLDGASTFHGGAGSTVHFGSATDTGTVLLSPTSSSIRTGNVAIDGGTVRLGNSKGADLLYYTGRNGVAIGTGPTTATLDLGGVSAKVNKLSGNAQGVITNTGAAAQLVIESVADTTFAGTFQNGTGHLTVSKTTFGTLTLSGDSTGFTGSFAINGGTLALAHANALGSAGVTFSGDSALVAKGVDVAVSTTVTNQVGVNMTLGATSGNTLSLTGAATFLSGSGSTVHFGSATNTGIVELAVSGATITASSAAIHGGTVRIGNSVATFVLNTSSAEGIAIGTGAATAILDINGFSPMLGNLTGNAQGNITNTGAAARLYAVNGADTTFAGVIKDGTGQLALTKWGSGALTLAGANIYTGSTLIEAGTLDVTGSINSAGVTVGTGGTLKVDGASLLDSATVTLNGTGNMTLSGDETIGTLVSASSTSGLTLGANTLTVAPASATTFAGAITGTGGLSKTGAGTLTLSGSSAGFTGLVTVGAGTLVVNGQMQNAQMTVGLNGRLQGNGTLGGLVVNGTLAPGNSIGTLNVAGDVAFNAGSTFEVEIKAPSQSDLVSATGTATIDGGALQIIKLDPDTSYAAGQTYRIIHADGGVIRNTNFTYAQPFSLLRTDVTYGSDFVDLTLFGGLPYTMISDSYNQTQAATGLQDLVQTGDALAVYNEIVQLSLLFDGGAATRGAFDSASGEVHASGKLVVDRSFSLFSHILRQQGAAGLGSGSTGARSFSAPLGNGAANAVSRASTIDRFSFATSGQRRGLDVWAAPLGGSGTVEADGNAGALDWSMGGVAGGYEGPLDVANGDAWLGFGAGYLKSNGSAAARRSSLDAENFNIGVYGGWTEGPWTLSGSLAYMASNVSSERRIAFGAVNRTATADYWTHSLGFSGEAAYAFAIAPRTTLSPVATLDLGWSGHGGYSETGAGALNLTSGAESRTRLDAGVGVALAHTIPTNTGAVTLQARAVWEHAFADTMPGQDLAFAGSPTGFTARGPATGRDRLRVGAGISIQMTQDLSIRANYDGVFTGEQKNHTASVGFNFKF